MPLDTARLRRQRDDIADEMVQTEAKALFEQVLSAFYFPDKSKVHEFVGTKIENLIAYLEKHDC